MMYRLKCILFFGLLVLLSFVTLQITPGSAFSQEPGAKLNVLVLSSFPKDIPAQAAFEKGLDGVLGYKKGRNNLYLEFMESPRLREENVFNGFADYLKKKYHGVNFDYLVGWSPRAIKFLMLHKDLFDNAQRFYVESFSQEKEKEQRLKEQAVLFGVRQDYRSSLEEVFRIENPQRIYVIGTTTGTAARERIKYFEEALDEVKPNTEVEYLSDQTLQQVATRLERVEGDVVAFYLLMFSDGEGTGMTPYAVVEKLAARSRIPIYSFWESLMGSGVVGGNVMSIEKIGHLIGERLLFPEKGRSLTEEFTPMRYVYDWRALKRWRIPEKMVPQSAVIINKPPDILTEYRWHIIIIAIVVGGLSILSFSLVRMLRLRNIAVNELAIERRSLAKKVEERTAELWTANLELKNNEERFHCLSDAAFEGISFVENEILIEANMAMALMFRYQLQELTGKKIGDLIVDDKREAFLEKYQSGFDEPYETVGLTKGGGRFPLELHSRNSQFKGRSVKVVAVRDLTKQKKAEDEIKVLQGILPICSNCKKIRDDEGAWKLMEEYISDHSEAEFSHGICQDCLRRLYPDIKE